MQFVYTPVLKGGHAQLLLPATCAGQNLIVCPFRKLDDLMAARLPKAVREECRTLINRELRESPASMGRSMLQVHLRAVLKNLDRATFGDLVENAALDACTRFL